MLNSSILTKLQEITGKETYDMIINTFGGAYLAFPSRKTIERAKIKQQIKSLADSGMPAGEISMMFPGVPLSSIYLIKKEQPKNSTNKEINDQLKTLIGQDLYSKLINSFGGQSVYIPTREHYNRLAFKEQVEELLKREMKVGEIAEKIPDISLTTLYKWKKEYSKNKGGVQKDVGR